MAERVIQTVWTLAVTAAIVSAAAAGAGIWLVINRPDTVAKAVADGGVTQLAQTLIVMLVEALRALASYL